MKRSLTVLLAGTMTALAVAASGAAVTSTNAAPAPEQDRASSSTKSSGPRAYGLTRNGVLVKFPLARPSDGRVVGRITGLDVDTRLVGIDFRPENGLLYGVGDQGGLYTIALRSAVATRVGQLTVPLVGQRFGVDFNPAVDALRIVSDTGQNLRAIPSATSPTGAARVTGDTFVDGTLNYGGVAATGVGAAAYTNNDNDPATGTTLFDIDTRLDDLVRQDPPNGGTLVRIADLGTPTESLAGFDIRTLGTTNVAYLATTDQRGNGATLATLHTIDLTTGETTTLGKIGGPKTVRGIAVAP
jgi:hypothetical protein